MTTEGLVAQPRSGQREKREGRTGTSEASRDETRRWASSPDRARHTVHPEADDAGEGDQGRIRSGCR